MSDSGTHRLLVDIRRSAWKALSSKRIYFGHQSVGYNILDGVQAVMDENPQVQLHIVETSNPGDITGPMLAHSRIGRNGDAKSKLDAFAALMRSGVADQVDVAFFKLCYVDVTAEASARQLFAEYEKTMLHLRAQYPRTLFVHITVPLTTIETGITARIKRLVGRPVRRFEDNIRRCQFNTMLRAEYQGKEPVFDLAEREATSPDGRRSVFEEEGRTCLALVPAYTDDGGHLNEVGRRLAAEQLLVTLANAAEGTGA